MSDEIKRMDISEFRRLGFLQEANRKFFHPHGLALEVVVHDNGTETLGGVWDYRDDPEGVAYGNVTEDMLDKAAAVWAEWLSHAEARSQLFGSPVQELRFGDEVED